MCTSILNTCGRNSDWQQALWLLEASWCFWSFLPAWHCVRRRCRSMNCAAMPSAPFLSVWVCSGHETPNPKRTP